jgi:hypothetical protein
MWSLVNRPVSWAHNYVLYPRRMSENADELGDISEAWRKTLMEAIPAPPWNHFTCTKSQRQVHQFSWLSGMRMWGCRDCGLLDNTPPDAFIICSKKILGVKRQLHWWGPLAPKGAANEWNCVLVCGRCEMWIRPMGRE